MPAERRRSARHSVPSTYSSATLAANQLFAAPEASSSSSSSSVPDVLPADTVLPEERESTSAAGKRAWPTEADEEEENAPSVSPTGRRMASSAALQPTALSSSSKAPRKKRVKVGEGLASQPSLQLPILLPIGLTALPTPPPSELSHSSSSLVPVASAAGSLSVAGAQKIAELASPPSIPTPSVSAASDGDDKIAAVASAVPAADVDGDSEGDLTSIDSNSDASGSDSDAGTIQFERRRRGGQKGIRRGSIARKPLASFVKRVVMPEPLGPAAEKVYCVEGFFTNRSTDTSMPGFPNGILNKGPIPYKPLELAAFLDADENEVKGQASASSPAPAEVEWKPAKARPSRAWVTVLPDGSIVDGKLPRNGGPLPTPAVVPLPLAAAKKSRKAGRYVWVTELPDGTTVDGLLPIPKTEQEGGEEAEVENVLPAGAEANEGAGDEDAPAARRSTRTRAGRASLPALSSAASQALNFQPIGRSGRASLGAAGSSASMSPAPVDLPPRRHGRQPAAPSASTSLGARTAAVNDEPFVFPEPSVMAFAKLEDEREFQLPYDIIWEWEKGVFDKKKKPSPFKAIAKNVFPHRGRDLAEVKSVCECKLPEDGSDGCGDACINRALQYLCSPKSCPCGERCSNKSLCKRTTPALKVFFTGSRGFGLKAMEAIPKGTFVIDYRGEVITLAEYYKRIQTAYKGRHDFYALEYGEGEVLDSGMKGNIARFINHGCAPNLRVHKYTTLGEGVEEYEVGFWSTRDIDPGEELFYDYNFDSFATRTAAAAMSNAPLPTTKKALAKKGGKKAADAGAKPEDEEDNGNGRQRCNCGAYVCTGWIGGAKKNAAKKAAAQPA